jgi:16S rRNA (cytosine1402-N4)-methyltransferase
MHLQNGMTVVDATLGGGGHASMMLAEIVPTGRVIALDMDQEALDRFEKRIASEESLRQAAADGRLVLVQSNYSEVASTLDTLGVKSVDGVLADLGYSSDQIESAGRGFSFQENGPLDMRLNQKTGRTARDIVNTATPAELLRILREYGDEVEAKRIVQAISDHRKIAPIETTHDLAELVAEAYPKRKRALSKIHPATKTFQALRIAVNEEFEHLDVFLGQAVERLVSGGRLAVITFHSGEDMRVKHFMKAQSTGCVCPPNFPVCRCDQKSRVKILTKRPIIAGPDEVMVNPRARSAKLRILEKL